MHNPESRLLTNHTTESIRIEYELKGLKFVEKGAKQPKACPRIWMILGFVGFLLVRVCVTLGCLSTPLCGMNDKKEIVIKALRAPSKYCSTGIIALVHVG